MGKLIPFWKNSQRSLDVVHSEVASTASALARRCADGSTIAPRKSCAKNGHNKLAKVHEADCALARLIELIPQLNELAGKIEAMNKLIPASLLDPAFDNRTDEVLSKIDRAKSHAICVVVSELARHQIRGRSSQPKNLVSTVGHHTDNMCDGLTHEPFIS